MIDYGAKRSNVIYVIPQTQDIERSNEQKNHLNSSTIQQQFISRSSHAKN